MEKRAEFLKAIEMRHVVRKYRQKAIASEVLAKLTNRVESLNQIWQTAIQVVVSGKSGLSLLGRMVLGKNANNYLVLAGKSQEKLGYCAADLMLYLQTLGLNSWFVGGTFNKHKLEENFHEPVCGIIVFGYGLDQGKAHKSKELYTVTEIKEDTPDWYLTGVKAALKAPTALNKQNFTFSYHDQQASLTVKASPYAEIERGILTYFFELASGHELTKSEIK